MQCIFSPKDIRYQHSILTRHPASIRHPLAYRIDHCTCRRGQSLITKLLPRLREAIASQQESLEGMQRVRTLSRVVRYALTVAVSVITVLLILGEFGISVAPSLVPPASLE